jgi:DNA transformation protein
MFGGAGVYRDGVMFALVSGDEVYLKCDDARSSRFREAGCRPFLYEKQGKTVEMSYWSVPEQALDDGELLKVYADLAFQSAVASKRRRKRHAKPDDA